MRGIILAGGNGSRLFPLTKTISKQLLPVYDKPLIYYSLSVLMLAGIREVMLISTERDIPMFKDILEDGKDLGIEISYKIQKEPKGIGEAFILGEEFIGKESVALILGDNLFYGYGLTGKLRDATFLERGALIAAYYVKDPKDFGVVEFNSEGKVISLEEKPENPRSDYAVPGLYFYDNSVIEKAKRLKPSLRGELEITDINRMYMEERTLSVINLGRGTAWFDSGTYEGLHEAADFVRTIQRRQGIMIACLEEIAYNNGWIDKEKVKEFAKPLLKSSYGEYLMRLIK